MSATDAVVRLQLGILSDPPVFPIDQRTGAEAQIWRGQTVVFELGIFGPDGAAVDLSGLSQLEVDIFPVPVLNRSPGTDFTYNPYSSCPFPNLPPAPLLFVTVPAADITATITRQQWLEGAACQARAVFDWSQTALLNLQGWERLDFWLFVHGLDSNGQRVPFGGSRLPVFETGSQGVFLQNNLAPLTVPAGAILYVGPNQQMPFTLPIDIAGTVVVDGVLVQV